MASVSRQSGVDRALHRSPVPASLKVVWTYEAGEPIESSAAIADGVVYVGTQSAELLALDLKTGKLLWKYKTS